MEKLNPFCDGWIANCGVQRVYFLLLVDCPQFVSSAAAKDDFSVVKNVKDVFTKVCGASMVAELADGEE